MRGDRIRHIFRTISIVVSGVDEIA